MAKTKRLGVALTRRPALNALKHGLTAEDVVGPGEELSMWEGWQELFFSELQPVGAIESFLAHRVAAAAWRMARVERLEGALASVRLSEMPRVMLRSAKRDEGEGWELPDPKGHHMYDGLAKLARHEAAIERSFYRSMRALEERQELRRDREGAGKKGKRPGFAPELGG